MKRENNFYDQAVVWISGAGSGLGRALALELNRRGARVTAADLNATAVADTAAQADGNVDTAVVDVTDSAVVADSIAETVARHGRIDYVFNNAGIGGVMGEVQFFDARHWDQVIDVNIRGVVNGIAAAYPVMVEQGKGHIVNTASIAGLVGTPAAVPYGATKHAVVGLTKGLRIEAAVHGVRVSALCPAAIETRIMDSANPPDLAGRVRWTPNLRRYLGNIAGIGAPEGFAVHALSQVASNRELIVYGARPSLVARLARWSPWLVAKVAAKEYRAERQRQSKT